jgi:hypothetical protein
MKHYQVSRKPERKELCTLDVSKFDLSIAGPVQGKVCTCRTITLRAVPRMEFKRGHNASRSQGAASYVAN